MRAIVGSASSAIEMEPASRWHWRRACLAMVAAGRSAFGSLRLEKGYRLWGTDMTAEQIHQTGLAQVRGLRGEIATTERARKRVEYDIYYIENWSPLLDIRIMIETMLKLVWDKNAY